MLRKQRMLRGRNLPALVLHNRCSRERKRSRELFVGAAAMFNLSGNWRIFD
jgi:hypothetical protein